MPTACLTAATFTRPDGSLAVRGLTWAVASGETWTVTGPGGSGKTSLAESLAGRTRLTAGEAALPKVEQIRLVGFRERSRRFDHLAHHHAERFNPTDPLLAVSVADYLATDPGELLDRLDVRRLLGRPMLTLSNGENRRVRLTRALAHRPTLLVLDEPTLGVDVTGRAVLGELLTERAAAGLATILTARPDRVPEWATHILDLGTGWQGLSADWPRPVVTDAAVDAPACVAGELIAEMRQVTVRHAGRIILDRVTWAIRRGERWAVIGPNGAGKSTLLSLLAGDHPQAFSNSVHLFGRRRGTGETVWELKRRIGFVSPEFHLCFGEPLTARRAIATGFGDTLVSRPTTPAQDAAVNRLLTAFGLANVADVPFARLPGGTQRLVLVGRAVVKEPDLLILDEPFQGLDADAVRQVRSWLANHLRPDQALVLVTHHLDELPPTTHTLRLDNGQVV